VSVGTGFIFRCAGFDIQCKVRGFVEGSLVASERARNLRRQGIAAAKAGQNDQARALLQQSLRLEPGNEAAWVWLASIARDQRERLFCFQKLLEINPQNSTALQALQSMGITPQQLLNAQPSAPQRPAEAQQPEETTITAAPARATGIPVPDPQQLAAAQQTVDDLIRQYRQTYDRLEGIEWVQKTRGRAGERDSLYLRLYMWSAVVGVIAAILIIGGLIVWNTPGLRGIVFAPTHTPTFTPTIPPTATPGLTETPSPTPELTLTPSPTINPEIVEGNIFAQPVPTRIYPEVTNRRLADAVNLIDRGQYSTALDILVEERLATANSFDPAPYYYEALALMGAGDLDSAFDRLSEAEGRLGEQPNRNFKPLIDAGFAQVHVRAAEAAFAQNAGNRARDQLEAAEIRAQSALEGDNLLVPAYLALAQRHALVQDYDDALRTLNDALSEDALKADVNLITARGEIYYQQEEYARAGQDAYTALYIDPFAEDAYLLQIRSALAAGDPGLAVIYSNGYLLPGRFEGSAEGYRLRADARVAEGNLDLALQDYSQALTAEQETAATVPALLGRAQIYLSQRRYEQARADLTRAYDLSGDAEIRALRMEAAYLAGNLRTARTDAAALIGQRRAPR
jgi:tetratricopeptide (TPR) repeat protein